MRILIIDDDRDFADSLAELLQLDGHHVELALSGEMGVELFRATQFDKVFIDIKLGDQNGLEILAILKAERPDIDASLITRCHARQFSDHAKDLGVKDILQKPFSTDEIRAIREQLQSK